MPGSSRYEALALLALMATDVKFQLHYSLHYGKFG